MQPFCGQSKWIWLWIREYFHFNAFLWWIEILKGAGLITLKLSFKMKLTHMTKKFMT